MLTKLLTTLHTASQPLQECITEEIYALLTDTTLNHILPFLDSLRTKQYTPYHINLLRRLFSQPLDIANLTSQYITNSQQFAKLLNSNLANPTGICQGLRINPSPYAPRKIELNPTKLLNEFEPLLGFPEKDISNEKISSNDMHKKMKEQFSLGGVSHDGIDAMISDVTTVSEESCKSDNSSALKSFAFLNTGYAVINHECAKKLKAEYPYKMAIKIESFIKTFLLLLESDILSPYWSKRQTAAEMLYIMTDEMRNSEMWNDISYTIELNVNVSEESFDSYEIKILSQTIVNTCDKAQFMDSLYRRVFVSTLMDKFTDFQDNIALMPVRESMVVLFDKIIEFGNNDTESLIKYSNDQMSNEKNWTFVYNCLLLLSSMAKHGKKFPFDIFLEGLDKQNEIRVLCANTLINAIDKKYQFTQLNLDSIVSKISGSIESLDDIDSASEILLSLLNKLCDSYKITISGIDSYLPLVYHKNLSVRTNLYNLLSRIPNISHNAAIAIVQAYCFENDISTIYSILKKESNLYQFICTPLVRQLSTEVKIKDFSLFKFVSNASITCSSYYEVINEPLLEQEIYAQFYIRQSRMAKLLGNIAVKENCFNEIWDYVYSRSNSISRETLGSLQYVYYSNQPSPGDPQLNYASFGLNNVVSEFYNLYGYVKDNYNVAESLITRLQEIITKGGDFISNYTMIGGIINECTTIIQKAFDHTSYTTLYTQYYAYINAIKQMYADSTEISNAWYGINSSILLKDALKSNTTKLNQFIQPLIKALEWPYESKVKDICCKAATSIIKYCEESRPAINSKLIPILLSHNSNFVKKYFNKYKGNSLIANNKALLSMLLSPQSNENLIFKILKHSSSEQRPQLLEISKAYRESQHQSIELHIRLLTLCENYKEFTDWVVSLMNGSAQFPFQILQHLLTIEMPKGYINYLPIYIPCMLRLLSAKITDKTIIYKCLSLILKLTPQLTKILSTTNDPSLENAKDLLHQISTQKFSEHIDFNIKLKFSLRNYQCAAVNWLKFMRKYNMSCALCDDMGLGKTVQALTLLLDAYSNDTTLGPSLIVCPSTLVKNWAFEIDKFFDCKLKIYISTNCSDYESDQYQLYIMSYEKVRQCIGNLSTIYFDTIILDEVHVIKNPKAKITAAIHSLNALHKIALSGTPIQNNVSEIWSIFEFLMPGFLGNLKQFNAEYTSTLTASVKTVGKIEETSIFETSLQNLKKTISPFVLRRTKAQVLKDLPPKIIQDYPCALSDLQRHIMQQLKLPQDIKEDEDVDKSHESFGSINQMLSLCDHPLLLLNGNSKKSKSFSEFYKAIAEIKDPFLYCGKFCAMEQLLGSMNINKEDSEEAIPIHKIIIFSHFKEMLNLIQKEFLYQYPNLKYLRLDGDTPVAQRVDLCNNFNSDPSITILLSTTKIGGLGLNLTSADTVIFIDHDWNPMVDLQAMDRAHRIGQLKVLNVYRLISVDTLEETLMKVQKFKKRVANALVESKNVSEESIDIGQIMSGIVTSIG